MMRMNHQTHALYSNTKKPFFQHDMLLDALPAVIFITNNNDRIIYANKKFNNEISSENVAVNLSMHEVIDEQHWKSWKKHIAKLTSANDDNSCVFNIYFDTACALKYFKLEGKVFTRDEDNNPELYFFTAEEITSEPGEEHNSNLNENIEAECKNFAAKKPGEKQMKLAIKNLERSNKELEEFAYIASHDLQEPLRKITAFSSRLEHKFNDKLGDEGKFFIQKINTAADGMKQLIDNLLQISKTAQCNKPFEPTDLNTILNQVQQNLDLKIEERHAQVTHNHLPVIDALPLQMMQLFSNILCNAIKFTVPGKAPVIHINAEEITEHEKRTLQLPLHKGYYKITFSDNGIGFSPESATEIFKIFCRLHGKTEYPGTGIGLAICSKIIEKHNGIIWAESELGNGSVFNILLPKKQD